MGIKAIYAEIYTDKRVKCKGTPAPLFFTKAFRGIPGEGNLFQLCALPEIFFLHVGGLHQSERVNLQASKGNRCIMGRIKKLCCIWYVISK